MRIVVLGGTGFLGQHVMAQLRDAGHTPVSFSRREGCDIMEAARFSAALQTARPDVVINCAAHVGSVQYAIAHAADMIHDNTQMVGNIYRAVLNACPDAKLINPISNCSYPGEANTHYEPDWQNGAVHDSVLAYAMPRRMIYALAESYRKQYGLRSVNWLVANAYGPGDYTDPMKVHALNGIIIRLIRAMRAGDETFEIWGTGKPLREWVYIEDVARMLVQSIEIDAQVYPLNLAQNRGYSIAEIAAMAAEALDYHVTFRYNTAYADGAPFKILDDRQFRAAHEDFQFTPIDEGIRRTIAYYQQALD